MTGYYPTIHDLRAEVEGEIEARDRVREEDRERDLAELRAERERAYDGEWLIVPPDVASYFPEDPPPDVAERQAEEALKREREEERRRERRYRPDTLPDPRKPAAIQVAHLRHWALGFGGCPRSRWRAELAKLGELLEQISVALDDEEARGE